MTILLCIEKPGLQLVVCGTPSPAWLEWLRTAEVPLTADQLEWREVLRANDSDTATPPESTP